MKRSSVPTIRQQVRFTQGEMAGSDQEQVNDIDASQVKDNDRVMCHGTYSKDGVLHATLISKRLSR